MAGGFWPGVFGSGDRVMVLSTLLTTLRSTLLTLRVFFKLGIVLNVLLYGPALAMDHLQDPLRILALGNSLIAGYGLDDPEDAFSARLQVALRAVGHNTTIIPGGISGDTTAGGLARLDWMLADHPDAVIVELGGNDGLRALNPEVTYNNLSAILTRLKADEIPVLLTGMLAPPNLGKDYGQRFNSIFPNLAIEFDVLFYPFFLTDVAAVAHLNQDDRIHPNNLGVEVIVRRIMPYVEKLIEQVNGKRKRQATSEASGTVGP